MKRFREEKGPAMKGFGALKRTFCNILLVQRKPTEETEGDLGGGGKIENTEKEM